MIARVPTGGYVDIMEMRVSRVNGRNVLNVAIRHESLDRKPDAFSKMTFEEGLHPPIRKTHPFPKRRPVPQASGTIFFGMADWDRDGHRDLVVVNRANGDLMLYPGESKRGYSQAQPVKIGNGWTGYSPFGMADWDGDGHQDIIARHDASGDLFLYPGESTRAYSTHQRVQIGNGWNGTTFFGTGDYDGDRHADIVVRRDSTGELLLYPGESVRGYSQQQPLVIGTGWLGYLPFGLADYDGDRHLDILTVAPNGDLKVYPGESRRAVPTAQPLTIASGWRGDRSFGVGDWDGDGHVDIVTRRSGLLFLYSGPGRRSPLNSSAIQIGNGW